MTEETDKHNLSAQLSAIIGARTVSLVGNSKSILASSNGELIDRGCVVRLNCGVPIRPSAQGRRVDLHCFTTRASFNANMAKSAWRVRMRRHFFDGVFSVWMSHADRENCDEPNQAFYPLSMLEELKTAVGSPPSVGLRAIDMLTRLVTNDIQLFGFDFKQTPTFYRKKENSGLHDWRREREYVLELERNGRVRLIG